jgi:ketosteroid isomerase-like protein
VAVKAESRLSRDYICTESSTPSRDTPRAMSEENVKVVRRAAEAMIAGDAATALGALDPDVEWHATVGGIDEGRVYRGPEEVAKAFADYFETWERIELHAEDYLDAGGENVVVLWHEVAKGRESGVVVETDTGTVNTVRNGKIVQVRSYMDRAEALRVAGLSA